MEFKGTKLELGIKKEIPMYDAGLGLYWNRIESKDREILCTITHKDFKTTESITNLFQSAPDLLEALQEMLNEFHVITDARNEQEQEDAINKAKQAIEKALK